MRCFKRKKLHNATFLPKSIDKLGILWYNNSTLTDYCFARILRIENALAVGTTAMCY